MKFTTERLAHVMPTVFAVVMIAVCRLLPHPWNFVPVTAAAIFGGIYLNKKWAFVLPIASMLVADLFLGFSIPDMPFVYGSILLSVMIGMWIRERREKKAVFVMSVVSGTLGSSILFYLITNLGSWLILDIYTKDLSGLLQSYVMALPFFRNSIAGDLLFVGVFVAVYEMVSRMVSKTVKEPVPVAAK